MFRVLWKTQLPIFSDLKPENILIKSDWHIMLSDFGSAKVIGYEGDGWSFVCVEMSNKQTLLDQLKNQPKPVKQRSTFVGTAQYISPEVAAGRSCGFESDFWALGSIIFQMVSGQVRQSYSCVLSGVVGSCFSGIQRSTRVRLLHKHTRIRLFILLTHLQPPFRGINGYQILQKINKLQYCFPEGFDETAKDLVKKLLVIEIDDRLGHNGIEEIKEHPFFAVDN